MQDEQRGKPNRLPAIAPKDDQVSPTSSRGARLSGPAVPPRARLPPRSRTGCWTCRQRKVKCDEHRPVCGQCARLGHNCDYSPRLAFRDDTQRVVERMQEVTVSGGSVWDTLSSPTPSSTGSAIADDLPPFAQLLTDDDREEKAKASSPGTYNVVVNPDSFQHLPEYSEDTDVKSERLSPLRRGSIAASLASSMGRETPADAVPVPGDPNTVVLPRFEDLSRRTTRDLKSPVSPIVTQSAVKNEDIKLQATRTDHDPFVLDHFRNFVWKQLVPTESTQRRSVKLLDDIAAVFPPLMHVMMAVASQSLAQRSGRESYEALQQYTQALNLLKLEGDSASADGVFLTHFLMLIYEIATADPQHSLIPTHHLQMLLKLVLLRRTKNNTEKFPFIIWWICNIDLDALFSGIGAGEFMGRLMQSDAIPTPSFHLYPLGEDGCSVVYDDERATLPLVLQLDYEVTQLALRIVNLSQEFRADLQFPLRMRRQKEVFIQIRQSQIFEYQESLRQMWLAPAVVNMGESVLPPRAQRIWEHAYSLYRACLIYSHTSMWSGQRTDTHPHFNGEIAQAATEILQLSRSTIMSGHLECRFLVFPIFLAGFASTNGPEKQAALDLIGRMQHESVGRNTAATWQLLQAVYQRQTESFRNTGSSDDVDWIAVMHETGATIVNFGM